MPTGIDGLWKLARSREAAKSPWRQMIEMGALKVLRGIGPNFYQLAGFWQENVRWREMARYMNPREYSRAVDRLNRPTYQKLSQTKVAEKAILRLYNIRSTRLLGLFNPVAGRSAEGDPLRTVEELSAFLGRIAPRRICFKAAEGWGGLSFRALAVSRDGETLRLHDLKDEAAVDLEQFVASLKLNRDRTSIIEEMLEQHPAFAAFNPTSVNTLRLWVIDHGQGPKTRLAYLRMGRAGALVDNRSSGGILAPVDMATGRLGMATDGTIHRRLFARHPDTDAPIEGVLLPSFDACRQLAEECLAVFPRLNFAGIDVALAPDGPVIIELNVVPDMVGSARVGIPTKDALAPF